MGSQVASPGFDPNAITLTGSPPSGTSFLTITASQDAEVGTSQLTVTAEGGGVTHTATSEARVDFGLVPVCYGAIEGIVTDRDTGLPIEGVQISGIQTDATGRYRIEDIALDENNSPIDYYVTAFKGSEYWFAQDHGIVVCDRTTNLDLEMVRVLPVRFSGHVVEGTVSPPDYDTVIPTATPIEGARVCISSAVCSDLTDATGAYGFTYQAGYLNEPADYPLTGFKDAPPTPGEHRHSYWSNFVSVHVEGGDEVERDIALVKMCTGSISGTVLDQAGDPMRDVGVSAGNPIDGDQVRTDQEGRFLFPELLLGPNNRPIDYTVQILAGDNPFKPVHLEGCGDSETTELHVRAQRFGAIDGRVIDEETRLPVEGATVGVPLGPPGNPLIDCPSNPCDETDADGHFLLEDVKIPFDKDSAEVPITAARDDYWGPLEHLIVVVRPNELSPAGDLELLLRKYGALTGVVRHAISHDPIRPTRRQACRTARSPRDLAI